MGSKRKKLEKRKDFIKPKLKVGKQKQKPDNYTDTSFTAKSILLPNQTIKRLNANEAVNFDLNRYLSLTRHHSGATRKEVLILITKHLPPNPSLYKEILSATIPLITDSSKDVREALVNLLVSCAETQKGVLDLHIKPLVLFVHLAMTHIQPDIRNTSTRFLSVLVSHSPSTLFRTYFIKTLRCYFSLLSWTLINDKRSVSLAATNSASMEAISKAARVNHLEVLKRFLMLSVGSLEEMKEEDYSHIVLPHPQSGLYLLPSSSQPFASLKLFDNVDFSSGYSSDPSGTYDFNKLENTATEDIETRRILFKEVFMELMKKNLMMLVKEGGELGREANACIRILDEV